MKRLILACALLLVFVARPAAQQPDGVAYVACSAAQAVTGATDMLHIEAGLDRPVAVWKVWIVPGTQTTAGFHQVVMRRTTSASTGGSTVVPSPIDPFGAAFTGVVRYGAAGGGANGVTLTAGSYFVATATTSTGAQDYVLFDATGDHTQPIVIAKGGTTGLEVNNATGGAGGANHYACALFTERIQ